ncbi:MAG: hypothetical protein H0V82_12080 [Candidatus Protochlamydia sp.]|nr:hypothetical protein [Candidatus Protochlamydia sp.]
MKNFDELAEEIKSRELTTEEVNLILQKVKELTLTQDKDLPRWIDLLGFAKEYEGFEAVIPEEYDRMIEKTVKDFQLLSLYCPLLESIKLGMPDDEVLARLDLFPKLLKFQIDNCTCITEKGVDHIWLLTHLTHLILQSYRDVYDVFIDSLCRLTNLIDLTLSGCHYVFYHNLESIAKLIHLRSLNLGASLVKDKGAPFIFNMKNLICLDLGGTPIGDQEILTLSSLPILKDLRICQCSNITDAGLNNLIFFPNLEFLDLSNCKNISDTGVLYLRNVSKLKIVHLTGCKQISVEAIEQLSTQMQVIRKPSNPRIIL